MKNKIKVLLIIITAMSLTIALLMTFTGCVKRLPVPVYEKTDEDGTSVYIDRVRYKELPKLQWAIDNVDEIIGYAGSYDTVIYNLKKDVNRDFIQIKYLGSDLNGSVLYRSDKDISDVSAESVDKIVWEDYEVKFDGKPESYEQLNFYTNTNEDKETIKEFFDLLETEENTQNFDSIKKDSNNYIMDIKLYCSDLPAAYYELSVGLDNGRIVCGKPITGYVYMPEDLLEKIVGKKLDIS